MIKKSRAGISLAPESESARWLWEAGRLPHFEFSDTLSDSELDYKPPFPSSANLRKYRGRSVIQTPDQTILDSERD